MIWKKIPLPGKRKKEGQEQKKKAVRRGVLRRRWLVNTLVTTFAIVAIAVSAFSLAIYNYYLATIAATLESKAQTAAGMFQNYTETTYLYAARQFINQFEEKNTIEVQFLTPDGEVRMTSLMDISGATPQGDDIEEAIQTKVLSTWRGEDTSTQDYLMAASAPIVYNGSVVGVVRLVTSLRLLQAQMLKVVGVSVLVGMVIIALMVLYASYFIRMILEPVTRVTETAKRIAAGSYGVQMEVRGDDEMGQLVDAINDMSMKIDQAEKTQSEFISSVSHELRTPLTAINGWAETLYNGEVRDAEDVKKGMGIIVSEARRLTNMVEELLEFSRIETGRFNLSVEPIDIKAELEDAVYTYREFFRRKGLKLEYIECEEEFPPSAATRSGCARCSATCWTTPTSTAGPGAKWMCPSTPRGTWWPSGCGTSAPASPKRSCPTSNTSSTRALPRPVAPASAWPCVRRSSPATAAPWILKTPWAAAAWSPCACP